MHSNIYAYSGILLHTLFKQLVMLTTVNFFLPFALDKWPWISSAASCRERWTSNKIWFSYTRNSSPAGVRLKLYTFSCLQNCYYSWILQGVRGVLIPGCILLILTGHCGCPPVGHTPCARESGMQRLALRYIKLQKAHLQNMHLICFPIMLQCNLRTDLNFVEGYV